MSNTSTPQIIVPEILTESDLRKSAPAIFATEPSRLVSNKYSFYSTSDVLPVLRDHGFVPTSAKQRRDAKSHGKHRIELFHESALDGMAVRGESPRIILENSHDRSSGLRIMAGFYRLVCSNGMVLPSGVNSELRVRHVGIDATEINKMIVGITDMMGRAAISVDKMRGRKLTNIEKSILSNYAREVRWANWPTAIPVEAKSLLAPRRPEDTGDDLWTVFNTIQENVIKGGVETTRKRRSRGVTSFSMDVIVNRRLWEGAEALLQGQRHLQSLRESL